MTTKKSFKQINPAEAFITMPKEDAPVAPEENTAEEAVAKLPSQIQKPPKGFKVNPMYVETRSKRVQLLLQPSVVEALKTYAKKKKQSMNETANEAIVRFLNSEASK